MTWKDGFRRDNELLLEVIGGWPMKAYFIIAAMTFLQQIRERLLACESTLACWASTFKAIIWSLAWPIYWINYVTDFVLFKPYS